MEQNLLSEELNYDDIPLYDFAQRPDVIDITMRYDRRFREYVRTHHFIKVGKVFAEGWAVAYIPSNMLETVISDLNESHVPALPRTLSLMGRASLISSGILQVQQRPFMDLKGRGVLLGFIDTGIDYTKNAFRYEDGSSKIKYIWDQTIKTEQKDRLFIGTEYTQEDINKALTGENPLEILPHKDEIGHGTFVASVAGSREDNEYLGAAPDSEIIMVKIRRLNDYYKKRLRVPEEEDDVYSSTDLMLGIQYIIDKAQELNRPVSICISLGTSFGAHDGSSVTEDYISNLAKIRGVAISVAAGNESNTRRHTQGIIESTGGHVNFEMRIAENAPSAAVYAWSVPQDIMYLTVKSPTGEIVSRRPGLKDEAFSQRLILEKSIVNLHYYFPYEGRGNNLVVLYIDQPTPGIWTITMNGTLIINGDIHLWLPIFINNQMMEFVTPTPNYTIITPSTATGVTTCGAYDQRNNSLFPASSWGPSRLPETLPDLVAPGVDVLGVLPTGYSNMSGTSVAAAMTAGASALMLQWGLVDGNYPNLNNLRIKSFLVQGCEREANMKYPNNQWGYGRLNLMQTFNILRRS